MKKFRVTPKSKVTASKRSTVTAANDYGWVVENWEAWDAYDLACDYFGEEEINRQILKAMGDEELAACLAFIFRMNDFREWDAYKGRETEE